ncbi:Gfo/Idh/MocA family protein [Pseudorhodoplanes sinuspersici]|uniref:4,5-dihydroxyphthalate dehydrogenase n=1 Tax=Pseudorhodoplanes sinuspersici TaxID=1235591 RepID=A0A1W6ZN11_9HYPH|nr:Gfo/Idh/MocA family oxidoreductase [Pseudorhodoplanes sinuspersici]ARP98665.1 4,5-dihydroxyphthalate dehydrogenase [Pseudorhodoplanes sinuspersici]RKE69742.1 4,5-dihydroxyphthalate dehydrogenase [Pseudorhodoplanes sinuspersici]
MADRKIRLGIAGLGRAFTLMLPTFTADPRIELVAASDLRDDARKQFENEFGARSYGAIEDLCRDPDVDAVYVATPHQMHAQHVAIAARHGKHVLVEKPMAIALDQCQAMIDAAKKAGVILVIGHSHSFNAPILHTRALIDSGAYGAVRMIHALNYTDYMVRPRRPEEMDTAQGGGVLFSQGAHQIDIVRLLGGGQVRSVRALTGNWDRSRPTEGAYSALLTFDDGAFASCTYSGYAHFDSDEFMGWIGEMGLRKDPSRYGAGRAALQAATNADEEAALKAERNYGGKNYAPSSHAVSPERLHQHFGTIIVSCERADLRPMAGGVMIYDDKEARLDPVPVPKVPRAEVIDEFYDAIVHGKSPLHDGAWSMATLEVCLAILQSAKTRAEVPTKHPIAVRT